MTGTEIAKPWADELAKYAKEQSEKEKPSLQYMSLKSGIMQLNKVQVPNNKLEVVVLASTFVRTFYTEKWDPNVRRNPRCFALSKTGLDMAPHEGVADPVNGTCKGCKFDAWKSDPHNPESKGKGCKEKRRLAFIPKASLLDGSVRKAEIAVVTLPVTSVKNWSNYVNLVAAEYKRPTWAVVTQISTQPHLNNQFTVNFEATGSVEDDTVLGELNARIEATEALLLTPYDEEGDMLTETGPTPPADPSKKKKY